MPPENLGKYCHFHRMPCQRGMTVFHLLDRGSHSYICSCCPHFPSSTNNMMTAISLVTHTAWLIYPVGPTNPIPDAWFVLKKYVLGGLDSCYWWSRGSPGASQEALVVENLPANAGDARDAGSIPGSRRSPGVENGNPFWFSCLDNLMDRGACRATVHGLQRVGHDWVNKHTQ